MLQLEKDLLEIQLQVSKWQPVVRKIMNPLYGYVHCSYLVSNATTYLDTNYIPNTETKLDIKFKLNDLDDNNICFSDNFGIGIRNSKLAYMFGEELVITDVDASVDAIYEVQLSKSGLFVNNLQVVERFSTSIDFVSDKTLLLGAGYDNDDVEILNSKNIYYCKVYDVDEFDYPVTEDGNMIMSVLNQVNLVDDTFESFGGTDDEIKDTLDEVMNKPKTKSNVPDLVRNYVGVRTDVTDESDIIYGFWNYADKNFYIATEGSYKGKDDIEYIELEYIQGTGTQYIDTMYKHKLNTTRIVADIDIQQTQVGNWCNPFGSWGNVQSSRVLYGIEFPSTNANSGANCYYGDATNWNYTNICGRKIFDWNKNVYKIGNDTHTFSLSSGVSIYNFFIFNACSYNGLPNPNSGCLKLYSFKIYDNDVLIRDYIPVKRVSDGAICLYDKVSETYFLNKGTGTFISGPEKNDKMKDLNTTDLLLRLDKKSVVSATQWYDRVSSKNITISNGEINTETNAINFNGASTIVDTTVAQSNLTSGYTVVTRFYPTTWNNYKGVFGLHDTGGQNGIVGLQYQDNTVYYGHRNNGNYYVSVNASEKLALNNWHTVICKFDGTYLYLYVDGNYIGKTNNNTPLTATGNIIVGKAYNEGNRFFAGQISDVLIYKRAITDNEINYIFTHIAGSEV